MILGLRELQIMEEKHPGEEGYNRLNSKYI